MERLTENKIVLIVRRTRLDDLVARFNTEDQARFYVEHLGADFSDYQAEDHTYKHAGGVKVLSHYREEGGGEAHPHHYGEYNSCLIIVDYGQGFRDNPI